MIRATFIGPVIGLVFCLVVAVVVLAIAGCEDARITCRSTCAPHGVHVATSTACVCRASDAGEGR